MKLTTLLILFLAPALIVKAQTQDTLTGTWQTQDTQASITISPADSTTYEGILTKYAPLKNSPIRIDLPTGFLNIKILRDLKANGKNKWSGKIYNPKDKKEYACNIKMIAFDKIKIRGFVGIPILGKTEYWTRVPN